MKAETSKPLALGLAFTALVLLSLTDTFPQPDLWGFLSYGQRFFHESTLDFKDGFSYLPVLSPWVFHAWLSCLLYYLIFEAFGGTGLQLLKYGLGLGTMLLAFFSARKRQAPGPAILASLFLLSGFLGQAFPLVKPQSFSYLFFVLSIYILESARKEKVKMLAWLPLVFLIWANLHGGFVAGLGIVFLYGLGLALMRKNSLPFFASWFACCLITLVNPHGPGLWKAVLAHTAQPWAEQHIMAWFSLYKILKTHAFHGHGGYFICILALGAGLSARFLKKDPPALLVLAATAWLSVSHIRHIPFFILAFQIYMPGPMASLWSGLKKKAGLVLASAVFLVLAGYNGLLLGFQIQAASGPALLMHLPARETDSLYQGAWYPVGAVDYLRQNQVRANILADQDWGHYLLWTLYPDCRVAVSGWLLTVHPDRVLEQYGDFLFQKPGWESFLTRYPHHMVLTKPGKWLDIYLDAHPGWEKAYAGPDAVLYWLSGGPGDPSPASGP